MSIVCSCVLVIVEPIKWDMATKMVALFFFPFRLPFGNKWFKEIFYLQLSRKVEGLKDWLYWLTLAFSCSPACLKVYGKCS